MGLGSTAGIVLIAGSLFFLVAAFMPLARVFAERSPQAKLKMIQDHLSVWKFEQVLFGLGAIVTAIGLALAAAQLSNPSVGLWVWLAAGLLLVGTVPWTWHCFLRAVNPGKFVEGALPSWQFPAYTFFSQAGLGLFGIPLLQTGYPLWLGWLCIAYSLGLFVLYLVYKDMPPFTYYLLTLVMGMVFLG